MTASISARTIEVLTAIATGLHDIADAVRETHDTAALAKEATVIRHKAAEHEGRMEKLEGEIAVAPTVTERERDEARAETEAFRDDLTALRDGLMERVGRYTPSDADLLAYVDGLRAQIATQEPAGATQGGSGDSRALGERLRALVAGPHPDVLLVRTAEGEWLGIVAEVERLEEKRARQAQTIGELQMVRERLTRQVERVRALADKYAQGRGGPTARRIREALDGEVAP